MKQYQVLNHIKLLAHYKNKEKCAKPFVQDKMHFLKVFFPIYVCTYNYVCVN